MHRRNSPRSVAETGHIGRDCHEDSMLVDVTRERPARPPPTDDAEEIVTDAPRDLVRRLSGQLETEAADLTPDDAMNGAIIANAPTFQEGEWRFGRRVVGNGSIASIGKVTARERRYSRPSRCNSSSLPTPASMTSNPSRRASSALTSRHLSAATASSA